MPDNLLAVSDLTVGALLTAFLTLSLLAFQVVSNVQRSKEREQDHVEAKETDYRRDLERCLAEKDALERAYDIADRKYMRLLREHDERNT